MHEMLFQPQNRQKTAELDHESLLLRFRDDEPGRRSMRSLASGELTDPWEADAEVLRPFHGTLAELEPMQALTRAFQAEQDLAQMHHRAVVTYGRALLLTTAEIASRILPGQSVELVLSRSDYEQWAYYLDKIRVGDAEQAIDIDELPEPDETVGIDDDILRLALELAQTLVMTESTEASVLGLLCQDMPANARMACVPGQKRAGWYVNGQFVDTITYDPDTGHAPQTLVIKLDEVLACDQHLDG